MELFGFVPLLRRLISIVAQVQSPPRKNTDVDVVAELKKFHSENYCPNRMHAVLIANRTLSELESLAHTSFDAVPEHSPACKKPFSGPRTDYPLGFSAGPPSPAVGKASSAAPSSTLGWGMTTQSVSRPQLWVMFPINVDGMFKEYKRGYSCFLEFLVLL